MCSREHPILVLNLRLFVSYILNGTNYFERIKITLRLYISKIFYGKDDFFERKSWLECYLFVGNRIGDLGVESLCTVLPTLPNLAHLGLVCNDITPEGLKHLCALLTTGTDTPLQVCIVTQTFRIHWNLILPVKCLLNVLSATICRVLQSWWIYCPSAKQLGSGWDAELLGILSESKLFALWLRLVE